MTDTTAPRTAARRDEHWCIKHGCTHGTLNGSLQLGSIFLAEWQKGYEVGRKEADQDRAEAIEPLLALVRAAQNLPTHAARAGHADCICVYHEDFRTALAALPESVRVAARKPE